MVKQAAILAAVASVIALTSARALTQPTSGFGYIKYETVTGESGNRIMEAESSQ